MYAESGRPSVPPERLLKSSLLIALYSVRRERQFCEQLEYNLLFRWFLDMDMLEPAFDASTFSKNRERLMEHDVAAAFFFAIRVEAADLMSREHFSVDGTMLEAWASMKSFRPKHDEAGDNNGWGDFRGRRRSNETHESKTDPEARLLRKGRGREAKLCYLGHALMENRHGLLVDLRVSEANGYAERELALTMLSEHVDRRASVGADRGYDTRDFVARCRQLGGDAARRAVRARSKTLRHRRAYDPARGLRAEPAHPHADRAHLRLGQERRRNATHSVPRQTQNSVRRLPRRRRVQPPTGRPAAPLRPVSGPARRRSGWSTPWRFIGCP